MSEFRFLHAADIHLDSPMRGLEADPDAPARLVREASRGAFRNLIDTAIAERVAFVLIAGDLFDGDWQDWRTGLFFVEHVARLSACGIPLIIVAGNHDAASVITRHLRLPEHVTLLPHDHCGQIVFDQLGVAIHGQSFPTRAVTEDLTRNYHDPVAGLYNIGLLHTSLSGRPGHENYAPTTVETLVRKGYDYWALGHVHSREIVHEDPWIVFPGNLQGRQAREGGPKGATLVTVRDRRVTAVDHRVLDVFRWCPIEVPVAGERNLDSAMDCIGRTLSTALDAAEGRPIAARITLTGVTPLHDRLLVEAERVRQGVLAEARHYGADTVWIESVVISTASTTDLQSLVGRPDVIARLSKMMDELVDEASPELLGDYPDRLRHRIPELELPAVHPFREGSTALLKRARELVLAHLAGEV